MLSRLCESYLIGTAAVCELAIQVILRLVELVPSCCGDVSVIVPAVIRRLRSGIPCTSATFRFLEALLRSETRILFREVSSLAEDVRVWFRLIR